MNVEQDLSVLIAERDHYRRTLEHLANHKFTDGYKNECEWMKWVARNALRSEAERLTLGEDRREVWEQRERERARVDG